MSENVLTAFFQALGRKDMDAVLALVDPAADFVAVRPEPSPELFLYGTYHGHDGVRRFFAGLSEAFEPQTFTIEKTMQDGDSAVAWGHLRHRVRSTGALFDTAWAVACRIRDGRIAHYRFFEDTAALHAAFGVGA
ncbi:nuclear transport factor 2 family protein [Azospirillum sp. sgz302134]